jgi:hypothetical protein
MIDRIIFKNTEILNQASDVLAKDNQLKTKGKRKGEGMAPAVSLQDVFSDPENAHGIQEKTLASPKPDMEKLTQLKRERIKKSKRNSSAGRKKLPAGQLKIKKLQMYVTVEEYNKFLSLVQASGRRTIADFLRDIILNEKNAYNLTNKMELLRHLDILGKELGKIGNNINQIAKYANIQIKSGKVDSKTIIDFIGAMDKYMQTRRELTKAYRSMVRNE